MRYIQDLYGRYTNRVLDDIADLYLYMKQCEEDEIEPETQEYQIKLCDSASNNLIIIPFAIKDMILYGNIKNVNWFGPQRYYFETENYVLEFISNFEDPGIILHVYEIYNDKVMKYLFSPTSVTILPDIKETIKNELNI